MQHNDWYFLYCSVTSSPHADWNTFTLKMFSRLSQQVELVLLGQMNMGVCSCVQLCAVLHIHIVFKADAALLCKLIRTCLLLGVCKDLCTRWYDMELIIKLCVCPYCRVKRPGPTCGVCQWDSEGRESWEEWECAGQVQVRDAICLLVSYIRTICLLMSTPWVTKTPLTCHGTGQSTRDALI